MSTLEHSNMPNFFRILSMYAVCDKEIPYSRNSIWIPNSQLTVPRSVTLNSALREIIIFSIFLLDGPNNVRSSMYMATKIGMSLLTNTQGSKVMIVNPSGMRCLVRREYHSLGDCLSP